MELKGKIKIIKILKKSKIFTAEEGDVIEISLRIENTRSGGCDSKLYADYLDIINLTTGFEKGNSKNMFVKYLSTIEFKQIK